jgi:transcription elongation factor Elf1
VRLTAICITKGRCRNTRNTRQGSGSHPGSRRALLVRSFFLGDRQCVFLENDRRWKRGWSLNRRSSLSRTFQCRACSTASIRMLQTLSQYYIQIQFLPHRKHIVSPYLQVAHFVCALCAHRECLVCFVRCDVEIGISFGEVYASQGCVGIWRQQFASCSNTVPCVSIAQADAATSPISVFDGQAYTH